MVLLRMEMRTRKMLKRFDVVYSCTRLRGNMYYIYGFRTSLRFLLLQLIGNIISVLPCNGDVSEAPVSEHSSTSIMVLTSYDSPEQRAHSSHS